MPRMGTKDATNSPIPLPPLAEQRRIVAKLEELLEPLSRVQERLGNLTHDFPEQFKAAVLQKAIQGKLVPQRDDEPAVEQIGAAPKAAPFEIPAKWKWAKLKNFEAKRSTPTPDDLNDTVQLWSIPAYDAGAPVITSRANIGSSKKLVQEGDVLLSKIVPHIKRAWVVSHSDLMQVASTEWLVFHSDDYVGDFLTNLLKSPYFNGALMQTVSGMGSLKRASPKKLYETFIPLPPLAEQRRIVAKVEQLFSQVDELTARLSS